MLAVLILPALLAGCNARDYWDNKGTLAVRLSSAPAETQDIDKFQTLKLALRSVTVKPLNEIQNQHKVLFDPVLGIDLVTRHREQSGLLVFEKTFQRRPIESVSVSIFVHEIMDLEGNRIPVCDLTKKGAERVRPCVAIAPGGNYVFTPDGNAVEVKRGGKTTIDFPLAIVCADIANKNNPCTPTTVPASKEYFIQSRSPQASIVHE